jgi:hypothetical protein
VVHAASGTVVPGTLSLGLKWPGREADRSSPTSAWIHGCIMFMNENFLLFKCLKFRLVNKYWQTFKVNKEKSGMRILSAKQRMREGNEL